MTSWEKVGQPLLLSPSGGLRGGGASPVHPPGARTAGVAQPFLGAAALGTAVGSWIGGLWGAGAGATIGGAVGYFGGAVVDTALSAYVVPALVTLAAVSAGGAYIAAGERALRDPNRGYRISLITFRRNKVDLGGHVSIAFYRDGTMVEAWGFWPGADISSNYVFGGTGSARIANDSAKVHSGRARQSADNFAVTKEEFEAAQAEVQRDRDRIATLKYNAWGRGGGESCASWAVRILAAAGKNGGSILSRYLCALPLEMNLYGLSEQPRG